MQVDEKYIVRNMTPAEVETIAVEWAAIEGWNPGLYDAKIFYNADPNGFFVGLLNNVPIACVSAVAYNAEFGFMGFYVVKPEYRRAGYSLRLYRTALRHLPTQNIGLDGVVEQQENYRKIGYKMAYRNIRYEGITTQHTSHFPNIFRISDVSLGSLIAYDSKLFPAPRAKFIEEWIDQPEGAAFAAVIDGAILGYGVIRKCRIGYKIGPLFADSKEIASQLLCSLTSSVLPNQPFYLDIPDENVRSVELVNDFSMLKVFETARMYSKSFPKIEMDKIFGITSFELG